MVTLGWGILLVATAIGFIGLKGTVVEVALGIASYTYGGLLGVFLLGLIHKEASEKDAIIGFITALIVMTIVITTLKIAWPLYTMVGAAAVILTGAVSSKLSARLNISGQG